MALTKNSQIDLNGNEMILDADGDTSITADTDDQIDFKTAGSDRVTIDSSGKVGIGAAPTLGALHVTSSLTDIVTFENTDAGTTGAQLILYHNSSSPADGDRVGALNFKGQDDAGNDTTYAGIRCLATDVSNTTEDGTLTFSTTRAGTFTEAMRIDESGKVGIGITSFDEGVLHVKSDDSGEVELLSLENSTGTNGKATLTFKTTSTDSTKSAQIFAERINASGHTDLAFRTFNGSTTERMRIDSSGHLLIGNGSTTYGNIKVRGSEFIAIGSGDTNLEFNFGSDQVNPSSGTAARDNAIDLGSSGARFDDIYATNGTIQTSDQNEKNTITNSDLGLDFINKLSPKSYKFNGKTRTHYGLIAQDVETVLSDISKSTGDFAGFIKGDISEKQDGSSYRYGLRYGEFIAPLIKAIQEQQVIIDDLKARITTLEGS